MATLRITYWGDIREGCPAHCLGGTNISTSGTSAAAPADIPLAAKAISVSSPDSAHFVAITATPGTAASEANGCYVPTGQIRDIRVNNVAGNGLGRVTAITTT